MLDWKILAASIVALLFISSLFVGGMGLRDAISGIINKVQEYLGSALGSSPFTGLFPAEAGKPQTLEGDKSDISILLRPRQLSLTLDNEAAISYEETVLSGFTGEVSLSFREKKVELISPPLSLTAPLTTLDIDSLTLETLNITDIPFEIDDITTDSGTLDIAGFQGKATATRKGLLLQGSVQSLTITISGLSFTLE